MERDVIVIGAGPAGLSLATSLARAGVSTAVVERLPRAVLADPPVDGRDIALTHRAVGILKSLGIWERFPAAEVAPIREARVLNGTSSFFLQFDTRGSGKTELGYLVSNQLIRRMAFEAALSHASVEIVDNVAVAGSTATPQGAEVRLADGRTLRAPLVVAADSRFSDARRRAGIGADMRDFGRVVIVCRMQHDRPHEQIAHECFHYGRTLAVLPLNGNVSSIVITLTTDQADGVMKMPVDEFNRLVRDQFDARLGDMRLAGERYAYPLVAVYADRFVAPRLALLGDAAVGMHPVTAHGFNFGLYGVEVLTRGIVAARSAGRDIGSDDVLSAYHAEHRRTTWPIYIGTNALVKLFTDDRLPLRVLRGAVLRAADLAAPLKAQITAQLTGTPAAPPQPLSR
jgi:ubiquinone biosynthesis UbiH/UbiF/VisC/COQ6 family hydroxylase